MTRNLWRAAASTTTSLLVVGAVMVLGAPSAVAAPVVNTSIPVPGLTVNCPPDKPPFGSAPVTISGVSATGIGGSCSSTFAHAAVGVAKFGANTIAGIAATCFSDGTSFSSVNGDTVTHTVVTPDGYTLNYNVLVTSGTQSGRIALQVITPGGAVVNLAEVLCTGPNYPLNAQLNTDQAPPLSPLSSTGHSSGSSALLLLGGALVAFVAVNLTVVRRYRHRHNGIGG